jgi:hypothetical protein
LQREFTPKDMSTFGDRPEEMHPDNGYVKDKIRQQVLGE